MGADEPSKELIGSLKELYSSREYSDLVISCGRKRYQVHRAIVCPQSEFFARACRGGFKEACEGEIDLPDDDPWLVHMMVHYLYNLDYLLQAPDKSGLSDMLETARDEPHADELARGVPDLVVHAKVYALAEKYFIGGLKALALRKFAVASANHLGIDDFLKAAQEVYTSTIEKDRRLRDIIVKPLYENLTWLDEEEAQGVIKGLGTLTYDLVMYMRQYSEFYAR